MNKKKSMQFHPYTVIEKRWDTQETIVLRVIPVEHRKALSFLPGQFCLIHILLFLSLIHDHFQLPHHHFSIILLSFVLSATVYGHAHCQK